MLACATHHTFVFKKIHSELIVYTSLIEPPYGMYVYFCVPKAGQVYIVYSTMDSTNSVLPVCILCDHYGYSKRPIYIPGFATFKKHP